MVITAAPDAERAATPAEAVGHGQPFPHRRDTHEMDRPHAATPIALIQLGAVVLVLAWLCLAAALSLVSGL